MTKAAFDRDNILTNDDRIASATKCLSLLSGSEDDMTEKESSFVTSMHEWVSKGQVSERQLAYLRDILEKY